MEVKKMKHPGLCGKDARLRKHGPILKDLK